MDQPTSTKLEVIIPAYRMHTQSFNNVLSGISEEAALQRIDNKTNHVLWMAGNLVNSRYWLASILDIGDTDPNDALFTQGKALDETLAYPTLEHLKNNFHDISPKVYKGLLEATDEQLEKPFPFGMNVSFVPENRLNIIGLCIGRVDYLLGQLGLMRKLIGLKGMSYDIGRKSQILVFFRQDLLAIERTNFYFG